MEEDQATIKTTDDRVVDAVLLASANETEHHEIAVYETLIANANADARGATGSLVFANAYRRPFGCSGRTAEGLERAGRPEHGGQHDARHGDGEPDDPGGDVLRPHDRRRRDADADDPAGGDQADEDRLDAAARA